MVDVGTIRKSRAPLRMKPEAEAALEQRKDSLLKQLFKGKSSKE